MSVEVTMDKKELIKRIESDVVAAILDCLNNDLDWGDFFEVADLVLGEENKQVRELRQLVKDVYNV